VPPRAGAHATPRRRAAPRPAHATPRRRVWAAAPATAPRPAPGSGRGPHFWATANLWHGSARAVRPAHATPANKNGAEPEARRRMSSGLPAEAGYELLVCARKSPLAAGADQGLDGLTCDLNGGLLQVRLEAAMRPDLVHPGRLRVESVHRDFSADGTGTSHRSSRIRSGNSGPVRDRPGRYDSTPFPPLRQEVVVPHAGASYGR
jgi:hypothetical protein